MINENAKKVFKIIGIIILVLFLFGVFRMFFDSGSQVKNQKGGYMMQDDGLGVPGSTGLPSADFGLPGMFLNDETGGAEESVSREMKSVAQSVSSVDSVSEEKKVIKNGNLTIKVESTDWSSDRVSQIAKEQGGFVFSTNFYERIKGQRSGTITIKVPVAKFEGTIEEIKKIATQVVNEFTTGTDVTEEYTDLQAQLKNKKAEEESFVKILDMSGKIDDVLAVTEQIARVRGEIERLEGRIKYLSSQTDMATITVNISEDIEITPVSNDWRPWQVIKKSFSELINNAQDFVDDFIRFIIVGIPSLIPFFLFLWLVYWGGKKIYQKIKA